VPLLKCLTPLSFVTATYPQPPNPSATSDVKLVLTSLCAPTTTKPTPRHFVESDKLRVHRPSHVRADGLHGRRGGEAEGKDKKGLVHGGTLCPYINTKDNFGPGWTDGVICLAVWASHV
jgi:hypothetical protein